MRSPANIRVAIVGSGAMASFFTAHLSPFCQLSLVGTWLNQLEALQNGVALIENGTTKLIQGFQVFQSNQAPKQSFDWVIILLKQWQPTQRINAAVELLDSASPFAAVISIQNGWQHQELLFQLMPKHQVCIGTTTQGAQLIAPAKVENTGFGVTTLQNHLPEETKRMLSQTFKQANLTLEWEANLDFLMAKKLMINAVINPLTVLYQQPNGGLLLMPQARALIYSLSAEVLKVFERHELAGMSLIMAQNIIYQVIVHTRLNTSSMLSDIKRGHPTEADAILGYIMHLAEARRHETPICKWLLQKVKNQSYKT